VGVGRGVGEPVGIGVLLGTGGIVEVGVGRFFSCSPPVVGVGVGIFVRFGIGVNVDCGV